MLLSLYRTLELPYPRREDYADGADGEDLYDFLRDDIERLHREDDEALTPHELDNLPVQDIWEMIIDRDAHRKAYERDVKTLIAYAKAFSNTSDETIAEATGLTRSTVNRYRNDEQARARAFRLAEDAVWLQRRRLTPDALAIVTTLRNADMPAEDRARSILAAAGITHPIGGPQ